MEKTVNKLLPEVAEKYNVRKGHPFKFVHPLVGPVDLNKISVKTADNLVKKGVDCLVAVKKKQKLS